MKKLLVFHPALAPYRVDFFNALADAFDAQFYFSYDNLTDQRFDQQKLRSQCRFDFRLLDRGMEIGGRSVRTGIFKLLRRTKPNIVICSEYSQITILVLVLKLLFGLKFKVYTISDDSIDLSVKRKGVRKWLRDIVSHYIDGIIFPSESVCNWYREHINAKTCVFPLPIVHDNRVFRSMLQKILPSAVLEQVHSGLTSKKIFLFVGRLVKIKNAGLLIHAFANAVVKMPDAVLVIIGDGEENLTLRNLANEFGLERNCLFLGRLEGEVLYTWLHIAHYLVLPSYQEPYGVVVNEALLAGCKVLCSKLAGAAELITPLNGFVFDPFDFEDLSQLMVSCYHGVNINSQKIGLKPDLMPFQLDEKLNSLVSLLKQ